MRSKADETLVIVETLICPLQISHLCTVYRYLEIIWEVSISPKIPVTEV